MRAVLEAHVLLEPQSMASPVFSFLLIFKPEQASGLRLPLLHFQSLQAVAYIVSKACKLQELLHD
jgi:hypothetical protein